MPSAAMSLIFSAAAMPTSPSTRPSRSSLCRPWMAAPPSCPTRHATAWASADRPVGHPRVHPESAPRVAVVAGWLLARRWRRGRRGGLGPHSGESQDRCGGLLRPSGRTRRGSARPPAHAPGYTMLREALVLADHSAYHIGEFAALRAVMGTWPASREGEG